MKNCCDGYCWYYFQNTEFNVKDRHGSSLVHIAVEVCDEKSLKILLAQENFHCWNPMNEYNITPLEISLMENPDWMVLLFKCKRVDLKLKFYSIEVEGLVELKCPVCLTEVEGGGDIFSCRNIIHFFL